MHHPKNPYLIWSGSAAVAAALLHIATIFGGPAWYRFIGATEPIIRMAAKGHSYPAIVCLVAAAILFACAGFAFSGAGLIPRLPFLRTGLVLITLALLAHGVVFIPVVIWKPEAMIYVYDGVGVNLNLIIISAICLAASVGYGWGTRLAWKRMSSKSAWR